MNVLELRQCRDVDLQFCGKVEKWACGFIIVGDAMMHEFCLKKYTFTFIRPFSLYHICLSVCTESNPNNQPPWFSINTEVDKHVNGMAS
jgi:hypothetical protein